MSLRRRPPPRSVGAWAGSQQVQQQPRLDRQTLQMMSRARLMTVTRQPLLPALVLLLLLLQAAVAAGAAQPGTRLLLLLLLRTWTLTLVQ